MIRSLLWILFIFWLGPVLCQYKGNADTKIPDLSPYCHNMNLSIQSRLLDSAMLQLEKFTEKEAWSKIGEGIKKVKKGDSGLTVLQVRKCFAEQGYHNNISNPVFDDLLEHLVKSFQFHHGLTTDGIIGRATLREINIPVSERIRIILANFPAAKKWEKEHAQRSVVINIPAFMLHANELSGTGFSCRVVVGKLEDPTAEFTAQMDEVVFNPYWEIPNSILKKEILPQIKKDPDFLKKNHMEWIGNRLRQKPGEDNALGKIKFIFPNSFNMYLHDTPAKQLFDRSIRAFSHGCIRVADPQALALFCLKGTEWGDLNKIEQLTHSGKERRIALKEKIPVRIVYLTAFADQSGHLNFRPDLYKKRQKGMKPPKKG
jgi:murein L,D-transpeptidase YcbB/YkuD